jgi:Undecaprenyl-phosphate galactose phosphotransferase WbaP
MTVQNDTATINPFHDVAEDSVMRGHRPLLCSLTFFAADCLAFAAAATLAACGARFGQSSLGVTASWADMSARLDVTILFIAMVGYIALKGRYSERTPFWTEAGLVACASICAAAAELLLGLFTHDTSGLGRGLATLLAFAVLAPAANAFAKRRLMAAGQWTLPVLVLGDGPSATEAEVALRSDRSLGYQFVGRIDPTMLRPDISPLRLRALMEQYGAKRLLIALDADGGLQRLITECALRELIPFAVVPAPHAFPAFGCKSARVFSHNTMFLSFREGLSRPTSRFFKATFDILIAAAAIAFLAPVLLGLVILCRLDGGPAFFAHWRIGTRGRPFRCLKFRTMVVDSDRVLRETLARDHVLAAEWTANRKLVEDPRITRVGQFLRKTSLDELPQLFNVLKLEMSLVGPRPIVENEIPLYGEHIAQYYAARPGLTGLWQVSGRNDTSYDRRVQLDVWYVNNWSIWHDIAVMLKTIPALLHRRGAY